MKVQIPLIEFLGKEPFKQDGSILAKFKDEYSTIKDSIKSTIRYDTTNYDVIWVRIFNGGIEDGFQVLTGERKENQMIKTLKPITLIQYKKAIDDIKKKEKKAQELKNQASTLKEAFYL